MRATGTRPSPGERRSGSDRAQLSLPLVEAGLGIVLILGLAGLLALGTPAPEAGDPQLDAYAADVATVLAEEPARHGGTTRLEEVTRSTERFEREAGPLERRVDDLLPDNLLFRLEVSVGGETRALGVDRPAGAVTGAETVTTRHGRVRVEVWRP